MKKLLIVLTILLSCTMVNAQFRIPYTDITDTDTIIRIHPQAQVWLTIYIHLWEKYLEECNVDSVVIGQQYLINNFTNPPTIDTVYQVDIKIPALAPTIEGFGEFMKGYWQFADP